MKILLSPKFQIYLSFNFKKLWNWTLCTLLYHYANFHNFYSTYLPQSMKKYKTALEIGEGGKPNGFDSWGILSFVVEGQKSDSWGRKSIYFLVWSCGLHGGSFVGSENSSNNFVTRCWIGSGWLVYHSLYNTCNWC